MANGGADNGENLIQYQFKVSKDTWEKWKMTVPRTKKLDERIIELIKEDLEKQTND